MKKINIGGRFIMNLEVLKMQVGGIKSLTALDHGDKFVVTMAGNTNPGEAEFGTIRGDYGREWPYKHIQNVVHTSDSVESAQREIKIWFPEFNFSK